MPLVSTPDSTYGNLQSYKFYIRPLAHRLFGDRYHRKHAVTKHQKNVQSLLEVLALEGSHTTWEMAKSNLVENDISVRTREKEFRRLLVGRHDRGKRSNGIVDVGLVVKDKISYNRGPAAEYRLSLHGVLYCLDVFELTDQQIDTVAKNYAKVLPKVFGRWDYLKSIVGNDVYRIRLLAKGLVLDNTEMQFDSIPFSELMSYISAKFRENFEYITEKHLADQISYWFYTNLLYSPDIGSSKKTAIWNC